jgi:hypothetical protein
MAFLFTNNVLAHTDQAKGHNMSDPKASAAQELTQVIDTGEESFSVDNIQPAESATQEVSEPAKKEEQVTTQPEDKGGEKKPKEKEEKPAKKEEPKPDEGEEFSQGVQKKIGKLTRKRRDAERLTDAEVKRRETAESDLEKLQKENEELRNAAVSNKKPNIDDFDSDELFYEALTDWKIDIRDAKTKAESKKTKAKKTEQELDDVEAGRIKEIHKTFGKGAEKYDDFDVVIKDLEVPTSTLSVFKSLENAVDVAYYLGNNPDEADDLKEMDAARAGAELQRISIKIKPKKTTSAPKPIKPVSTTGESVKSLDEMGMAEYNKTRDKQDKERSGRY